MIFVGRHTRQVHFPPVITDDQWSRIVQRSGLPPEARFHIDNLIGLYRQLRTDAKANHGNLWKKLQLARDSEAKSLRRLDDVISDQNASTAIATGLDGQLEISSDKSAAIEPYLQQSRKEKQSLLDWYDKALARVRSRKTGPRTGQLNKLLKAYTGKRISRSTNSNTPFDYVWEVCHIANEGLKRATVEDAVKRIVTDDRGDYAHDIDCSDELFRPSDQKEASHTELQITANVSKVPVWIEMSPGSVSISASRSAGTNHPSYRVISSRKK
jgi:hypothetical protein